MDRNAKDKQSPTDTRASYQVGQDNLQIFGLDINAPVFLTSSLAIVIFVLVVLVFQEQATVVLENLRVWMISHLDWVFLLTCSLLVLFCLYLIVSPLGKIRLGGQNAVPDYSTATWIAMLFSAGLAIGLVYFGVAEPVHHFQHPPFNMTKVYDATQVYDAQHPSPGLNDPDAQAAWDISLAAIAFHWGLHGWAGYAVVGLALAFFTYNRGLPLALRSAFYPLLGDRIWGWPGHIIDTLAVFATLFGLAPSLGLGAEQVTAGLNYLFDVPATNTTKVALIVLITAIATASVLSGIDVGIKRLSQFNICITVALFLFVIVVGPTGAIFSSFFRGLGTYIVEVVPFSNWVGRTDTYFIHDWSAFHMAWWIAWGPFVGTFIARISKGRTVRQFMLCVLILPMLITLLCMSTFGGTAIYQFLADGYTGVMESVAAGSYELALFKMFEHLPFTKLASFVSIVLLIIFFITSSDSGSLVVDTITAGGKLHAPVVQRVFWCSAEGFVAIALLLGGGLKAMQTAALASGFPFSLIILGMGICTWMALRKEANEALPSPAPPAP